MSNEDSVKKLKEKISKYITNLTPKGSKYPIGVGWSIWNSFEISKEESLTLFNEKSFYRFISAKTGSIYAFRAVVLHAASLHPELAVEILSSDKKSNLFPYKQTVISNGLYVDKIDPSIFKDYDAAAKVEYIKICSSDEVERFLKDPSDKVRMEAYHRRGMLSCAEEMSKDKSAKIRATICQVLPHNHPALENMVNDRSKWVFYSVLKKVNKSKIPMMLGSRHLKESFVNSILQKRMSNLGEK
jgi:hypothetical protein